MSLRFHHLRRHRYRSEGLITCAELLWRLVRFAIMHLSDCSTPERLHPLSLHCYHQCNHRDNIRQQRVGGFRPGWHKHEQLGEQHELHVRTDAQSGTCDVFYYHVGGRRVPCRHLQPHVVHLRHAEESCCWHPSQCTAACSSSSVANSRRIILFRITPYPLLQ